MPSNTYGRQVVESLVNKSGGAVAAGDVVIIDTTNDGAFTTTTTARSEVTIGIVQEAIASNATGRVLLSGYAALVNVPASVTRGHYVETHTVAKQATGSATRRSGSFGQFRTGGTTPTAVLWGNSDQTPPAAAATIAVTETLASGSTTMTNANQLYTGVTVTPAAGTYFFIGKIIVTQAFNGTDAVAAVLDYNGTVYDDAFVEIYNGGGGLQATLTVMAKITVSGSAAVSIQAAASRAGASIVRDARTNGGAVHKSTKIEYWPCT